MQIQLMISSTSSSKEEKSWVSVIFFSLQVEIDVISISKQLGRHETT